MQKTSLLILISFIIVIGLSNVSEASPIYYTFEGTVTSFTDDAGLISEQYGSNFGIGNSVSYTLLFDFDRNGEWTLYETGSVQEWGDDTFYVEIVSGSIIEAGGVGIEYTYGNNESLSAINVGDRYDHNAGGWRLMTGSDDEFFAISPTSVNPEDWTIGTSVSGYNRALDYGSNHYTNSRIYSDLRITDIYDSAPVPEPATVFLLGTGLFGFAGLRIKRKDRGIGA